MNRLAYLLVLLVAVMLAGCSSIMRPPSAAAFMSSYEKDAAVVNMSLALYGGDLDNNDKHYNHHKDMSESHSEWVLDLSEIVFWKIKAGQLPRPVIYPFHSLYTS